MKRTVAIVVAVAVAGFVLASAYWLSTPPDRRLAPFSDQDYAKTARSTAEGRAFVAKYPDAMTTVERSLAVIVDLGVDRAGHSLHLRFYMDAYRDRVLESFAYCDATQQRTEVIAYVESERCFAR